MVDDLLQKNEKFTMRDSLNDEDVEIQLDPKTRSQVFTTFEHHELHEADLFRAHLLKDIPNGLNFDIGIITDDEEATLKEVHFRFAVGVEGEALVSFYELVSSFSGGTPVLAHCANRVVANTAFTTFLADPTVTLGTPVLLMQDHLGSGHQVGGSVKSDNEWILKRNANYLIRITNLTALDNYVDAELVFYEHEPYF